MRAKVGLLVSLTVLACLLDSGVASAGGPYRFYPVNPCRLLDTRLDPGVPLTITQQYDYKVTGRCGVPAAAKAVFLNVVSISPTNQGFISAYPYPGPFPGNAVVNVDPGERALANGAIIPLGTDPNLQLSVVYGAAGGATSHLVLEIMGYFR
jgi:hypothetical protein